MSAVSKSQVNVDLNVEFDNLECTLRVCVLGSLQFKVADVIVLHKSSPSSLNVEANWNYDLKMQTSFLADFQHTSLVDFA